jgi:tetratricopeptide (TPR) repeat protein
MLDKLAAQARQAITLQGNGDLDAALAEYELVFEALRFYEELGCTQDVENIRRPVLEAQTSPEMALYFHALMLFHRRRHASAEDAAADALLLAPDMAALHTLLARVRTCRGDVAGALAAYERAQEVAPTSGEAREVLFMLTAEREMPGDDYYSWLQRFHERLRPATYVEIGLGHGRSLALAGAGTKAVGIDPYQGFWERLNYVCPHGPATLFPLASDDFFTRHDLREVIGRETFDLAFIDGLHLFDHVLRDFINLERYAGKDSVVLVHDCLPIAPIVAERERCTGFWTGDVWRIIPCLKTFRPDLRISTIPTKLSGLAVITGLDPASTALSENYQAIVDYYMGLKLPESAEDRFRLLNVNKDGWPATAVTSAA